MDIGTGKDLSEYTLTTQNSTSGKQNFSIPYHLIDIVDAGTKYNLFEYQRDFAAVYADMQYRKAFPIICGGTGLYIQAVTTAYDLKDVRPNEELRKELESKSMEELVGILTELKAQRGEKPHNNTDFDSKKRVIRAIEIEKAYICADNSLINSPLKQAESSDKDARVKKEESKNNSCSVRSSLEEGRVLPHKVLYLGIDVDRDVRNARIDRRLNARLQEGMIDEVQKLLDSGIKPEDLIYYGLEYKFVTLYLVGELSYDEMVEKLSIAIHQFAKRQMTWFRGMERKGIKIWWSTDGNIFRNNLDNNQLTLIELLQNN
jgi:tRNA dimethylallyltransferase